MLLPIIKTVITILAIVTVGTAGLFIYGYLSIRSNDPDKTEIPSQEELDECDAFLKQYYKKHPRAAKRLGQSYDKL